ncbi:hypothetical protein D3C86_1325020 [compost metagenome]
MSKAPGRVPLLSKPEGRGVGVGGAVRQAPGVGSTSAGSSGVGVVPLGLMASSPSSSEAQAASDNRQQARTSPPRSRETIMSKPFLYG